MFLLVITHPCSERDATIRRRLTCVKRCGSTSRVNGIGGLGILRRQRRPSWQPTLYNQLPASRRGADHLLPHSVADSIASRNFALVAAIPSLANALSIFLPLSYLNCWTSSGQWPSKFIVLGTRPIYLPFQQQNIGTSATSATSWTFSVGYC